MKVSIMPIIDYRYTLTVKNDLHSLYENLLYLQKKSSETKDLNLIKNLDQSMAILRKRVSDRIKFEKLDDLSTLSKNKVSLYVSAQRILADEKAINFYKKTLSYCMDTEKNLDLKLQSSSEISENALIYLELNVYIQDCKEDIVHLNDQLNYLNGHYLLLLFKIIDLKKSSEE
jgi:hypothetical protein